MTPVFSVNLFKCLLQQEANLACVDFLAPFFPIKLLWI